ncbi:hypothetical protein ACWKSP_22790 [Micromonosporaceae bacterium Da 78-11]
MGHVLARLTGYGMRLVPHWPYRFERHPSEPGTVRVARAAQGGPRTTLVRPGTPAGDSDVVDVTDGPAHQEWLIETSAATMRWPDGFTLESPLEARDRTPFYLLGPDEAAIWPQGPMPADKLAEPDALITEDQTVTARRELGRGITAVELSYEYDGRTWWQAHWLIPYGDDEMLVLTGQAPDTAAARTRTAGDFAALSAGPQVTDITP